MVIALIAISIIGYTVAHVLNTEEVMSWYHRLIFRLPTYLYKPLGGCGKCLAGQIALWYYVCMFDYSWYQHISFVTTAIFLANLIKITHDRIENS